MKSAAGREEHGAAAIFLALLISFVLLPLTAFAVDIGVQRVARRDAQSVADAAAQDAARALGTGTTDLVQLDAIATTTATGNATALGGVPDVTTYTGTLSASFTSDQALGCGSSHFNSYFTPTPAGTVPDAVLVVVRNSISFSFYGGDGGVCRSAIARAYKTACMVMDSYAAALRSGDSSVLGPLLKILGSNIDATALSGSGILTTDLDLLAFLNLLKTRLGVGSVSEVLTTQITAADLIAAEAAALTQQGGTAAGTVSVLNSQLGTKVGALVGKFTVGELLGIAQGGAAALGTTINAFDLAAAAVQLANGNNPLALTVALPAGLLGSTSVSATIGSRPTRVCLGDGTKKLGQTSVTANATLNRSNSAVLNAVNGLTTGLQDVVGGVLCLLSCEQNVVSLDSVAVSATASLAQASGRVDALNCTGATPDSMSIRQESSLAPATVSVTLTLKNVYTRRTLLGILVEGPTTSYTTFTLKLATADPADPTRSATLQVPDDYGKAKPGPSGDLSVGSLTVTSTVAGADAGNIVSGLLGGASTLVNNTMSLLVNPLLSTVVSPLLTTLTTALQNTVGLTVAGSSYTPLPTPSCGTPALVG